MSEGSVAAVRIGGAADGVLAYDCKFDRLSDGRAAAVSCGVDEGGVRKCLKPSGAGTGGSGVIVVCWADTEPKAIAAVATVRMYFTEHAPHQKNRYRIVRWLIAKTLLSEITFKYKLVNQF